MKFLKSITIAALLCSFSFAQAQNLKPFVRAFQTEKNLNQIKGELITEFQVNGIDVLGQYQPANDVNRWVIVVSSVELVQAAQKVGGIAATATAMRVAITVENGKTKVTYTNPNYWAHVYYANEVAKVTTEFNKFHEKLKTAFTACDATYKEVSIGSKTGIPTNDLHTYKYKFKAPTLQDFIVLGEFGNYQQAVSKVEGSIANGVANVTQVYAIEIPGKQVKIYGFGMDYEYDFMFKLDVGSPKHTAALPYEIMVVDNKVIMLDPKFRFALCFPDCTPEGYDIIDKTGQAIQEVLLKLAQ